MFLFFLSPRISSHSPFPTAGLMPQQAKKSKGKKTGKMTERERSWEELKVAEAFFEPGCSLKAMENLQGTIALA